MVYIVEKSVVESITEYFEKDLSPTEVCAVSSDEIDSVELMVNSETISVVHSVTSETDVYTINGEVAEDTKIDAVFTLLNGLEIDSTAEVGYNEGELYLEIVFKSGREGFEELTLRAYTFSTNFYRISFNGREDILVSLRDVEDLAAAIQALS